MSEFNYDRDEEKTEKLLNMTLREVLALHRVEMDENASELEHVGDDYICLLLNFRLLENDGAIVGGMMRAEIIGKGLSLAYKLFFQALLRTTKGFLEELTSVFLSRGEDPRTQE